MQSDCDDFGSQLVAASNSQDGVIDATGGGLGTSMRNVIQKNRRRGRRALLPGLFAAMAAATFGPGAARAQEPGPRVVQPANQSGVVMGEQVTVSLTGCDPGDPVRIRIGQLPIAAGVAGDDGTFTVNAFVPVVRLSNAPEAAEAAIVANCTDDPAEAPGALVVMTEPERSRAVTAMTATSTQVLVAEASGEIRSTQGLEDRLSLPGPLVGLAAIGSAAGDRYWAVDPAGHVAFSDGATDAGDISGMALNAPAVGMAVTASGEGYWLAAADGGVFAFGDAAFMGSLGGRSLNAPVVSIAPTTTSAGYRLVAADGGTFAFGDAQFPGSAANTPLFSPVVTAAMGPEGGVWMAELAGSVYALACDPVPGTGFDVPACPTSR